MNEARENEHSMNTRGYVKAFKSWMDDWADAFVTVNLPLERSAEREPAFYLNLWTRIAEAKVLGTRTRRMSTYDRRILWLFRREVSPAELIHYHGAVRFPENRRWRGEEGSAFEITERCDLLELALREASIKTLEPHARYLHNAGADIDVRPFHENSAHYLLKDMYRLCEPATEFRSEELLHDSGLIILPHLPPTNHRRH